MTIDINPYPGIHNKIRNKTRIMKKFIWLKKLKNKWKFMEFCYIKQICLQNEIGKSINSKEPKYLDWFDVEFVSRPTLFLRCGCGNELTSSGSFIIDTIDGVIYKCTDCNKLTLWNFDLAPCPIRQKIETSEIQKIITKWQK